MNRINKFKNLKIKMAQQLRENFTNDSQNQCIALTFFVEYPFIADFFIFYKGNKFAILFVDSLK